MKYILLLTLLFAGSCGGEIKVPPPITWEDRLCLKIENCELNLDFDCPDELYYEINHYQENCSDTTILEYYIELLQCWEQKEGCTPDCQQEFARFNYAEFVQSWCPPIPDYNP